MAKKAKKANKAKKAKKATKKTAAKARNAQAAKRSTSSRGSAKKAKRGSQKRQALKRGRKNVAYAKRRGDGSFKEIDEVGRSLKQDRATSSNTDVEPGYGDQGDNQQDEE